MENYNKKHLLAITVLMYTAFFLLTIYVLLNKKNGIDTYIESCFYKSNDSVKHLFKIIDKFISPMTIVSTSAIISFILFIKNYFCSKTRKEIENIFFVFENVFFALVINFIFKNLIKRIRPNNSEGFSYPSGHAMLVVSLLFSIYYIIIQSTKNRKIAYIYLLSSFAFSLFIGFTRIYLEKHYLTDVLGGYVLGYSVTLTFILFKRSKNIL
ncbi:phosphatase PAP2 family protein [Lacticaseibacillus paracasei]|uniref:phosphatase PAP2 family protein n=1 Tax=Lacticaseibacillus paracasei TaxID=1597 RepID=UPI002231AB63|nr:phosphatase PAP2 family protein [Lacticaseibacillus paracasei]UZD26740.1 phosphatase PAP2 family protein [Lacticaseibacillus paracasei]